MTLPLFVLVAVRGIGGLPLTVKRGGGGGGAYWVGDHTSVVASVFSCCPINHHDGSVGINKRGAYVELSIEKPTIFVPHQCQGLIPFLDQTGGLSSHPCTSPPREGQRS